MQRAAAPWHSALASFSFVAVATAFLPLGYSLRYLTVQPRELPVSTALAVLAAIALSIPHEAFFRGFLYRSLGERMPSPAPALTIALLGTLLPLWVRLTVLPSPRVPQAVLISQAAFVEFFLSLGLTWLALGTASWIPPAAGLSVLWVMRLTLAPRFHGGVVPMMEVWAALLSTLAVALVLSRPLAPHREDLFGGD